MIFIVASRPTGSDDVLFFPIFSFAIRPDADRLPWRPSSKILVRRARLAYPRHGRPPSAPGKNWGPAPARGKGRDVGGAARMTDRLLAVGSFSTDLPVPTDCVSPHQIAQLVRDGLLGRQARQSYRSFT